VFDLSVSLEPRRRTQKRGQFCVPSKISQNVLIQIGLTGLKCAEEILLTVLDRN
jgi:hypothetical protein